MRSGQYLLLTMAGPQGTFCIGTAGSAPWLIPAAVGGVALLAALAVIAGKRRRAKKTDKVPEAQEEPAAK